MDGRAGPHWCGGRFTNYSPTEVRVPIRGLPLICYSMGPIGARASPHGCEGHIFGRIKNSFWFGGGGIRTRVFGSESARSSTTPKLRGLQSHIFLPIFHVRLAACHKMALKKSSMVKIGQSEQKYGNYLFKVETFLSKRHQVNTFLSTFHVHVLYFWNPHAL